MRSLLAVVAVLSTTAAHAERVAPPPSRSPIPATARQLITGVTADWDATAVTLRRWVRRDGRWVADGPAWQGVVGKSGIAWGRGLHRSDERAKTDPVKREGDGKAPAGAFALRGTYGYAAAPPKGTSLPYTQSTASWQCVDDAASTHYTQILDRSAVEVDWKSAEQMRRKDALYTWVVDVAHNADASPGDGSCIFLHVWRNARSGTVGCTAMPEPTLAKLIAQLDPTAVYVLLPAARYDDLAASWALPAR